MIRIAPLPARGVVAITGADRVGFLQGLVSNDVALAGPGRAVWAALLTPQGKWLADFFILADADRLLLDVERDQAGMMVRLLGRFRLRAQASLADMSDTLHVHAAWGGVPVLPAGCIAAPDPRLPEAGWRILAPAPLIGGATAAEWNAHRLALGLPDGSADLEAEKTVLLEAGFDELGGIAWQKGCYMGQELTARTKYRGLLKRRLVAVDIAGPPPPPGTPVLRDGQEIGTMRSAAGARGLAVLRLEAIGPAPLACGQAVLTADPPAWMKLNPDR
ncbi:MAG: folate-binding protein YgfZ [Rhodospirillales bacterium]|nr:folate-binding protein YgfZ [Rhodospirillales bacterium]